MKVLGTALFDWLVQEKIANPHCLYDDPTLSNMIRRAIIDDRLDPELFEQLKSQPSQGSEPMASKVTPEQIFLGVHTNGGDGASAAGAKALGRYSTDKTVALHKKSKQPVIDANGVPRLTPSEFEMGMAGAFVKRLAARAGLNVTWRDEDAELLEESFKSNWVGEHDGTFHHRFPGSKVKALIGDATSGGVNILPEWWDASLITSALLHGELLPHVTVKDIPYGSEVQSGHVAHPEVSSGAGDDSTAPLVDTADLVSPVNATVHDATCFLELGKNFLNDSPTEVGAVLTSLIGESFAAWFDKVIAKGNGTTEPEGIVNASGTTAVNFNDVAPTVGGYESLIFGGIPAQYRKGAMAASFALCMNDTSYLRGRGIPVGAADERRVFGMDHRSYQLFDYPVRISNDLSNKQQFAGLLSKYRLWRRSGVMIEFSREGRTLIRENLILIAARTRVAGRVTLAEAFAVVEDAQA